MPLESYIIATAWYYIMAMLKNGWIQGGAYGVVGCLGRTMTLEGSYLDRHVTSLIMFFIKSVAKNNLIITASSSDFGFSVKIKT